MKRCLDESTLQSFTDGELSRHELDEVTNHLSRCDACALAVRQLAEENDLVLTALAPEFEAAVPTERLRMRLDTAIAGLHSSRGRDSLVQSWLRSLSAALAFRQPAVAYGAFAAVLLFATIAGVVYFKNSQRVPTLGSQMAGNQRVDPKGDEEALSPANPAAPGETVSKPTVTTTPDRTPKIRRTIRKNPRPTESVAKVELLPGERSYLRTIATLDSTINSSGRPMRPALRAEYERNLALVDRALAAARTAAKNNPNDPDAADFVFSAYQSKVDLLNTVADARSYNRQQ